MLTVQIRRFASRLYDEVKKKERKKKRNALRIPIEKKKIDVF